MLLANKIDLYESEVISLEEAMKFANLNDICFMEISCKENVNVFKALQKLVEITIKDFIETENISNYNDICNIT